MTRICEKLIKLIAKMLKYQIEIIHKKFTIFWQMLSLIEHDFQIIQSIFATHTDRFRVLQ